MRFAAGEIARYVVAGSVLSIPYVGEEVTVEFVGPFKADQSLPDGTRCGVSCDYAIRASDSAKLIANDFQLQKRHPPKESAAMTRHEEVEA